MIVHSTDIRAILFLNSTYVPELLGNGPTFTGGSAMIGTAWVALAKTSNTVNWNIALGIF